MTNLHCSITHIALIRKGQSPSVSDILFLRIIIIKDTRCIHSKAYSILFLRNRVLMKVLNYARFGFASKLYKFTNFFTDLLSSFTVFIYTSNFIILNYSIIPPSLQTGHDVWVSHGAWSTTPPRHECGTDTYVSRNPYSYAIFTIYCVGSSQVYYSTLRVIFGLHILKKLRKVCLERLIILEERSHQTKGDKKYTVLILLVYFVYINL